MRLCRFEGEIESVSSEERVRRGVEGRNTNWEKRKQRESSTRRSSKSFGFLDEPELRDRREEGIIGQWSNTKSKAEKWRREHTPRTKVMEFDPTPPIIDPPGRKVRATSDEALARSKGKSVVAKEESEGRISLKERTRS